MEVRKCSVITDLEFVYDAQKWKDLQTIIKIESAVHFKKTKIDTKSTRFYISSLPADAVILNHSIRSHWTIKNNLHWNLDVIFKEGHQEKPNQTAIENSNLIAKFAITMLDQEKTYTKSKNRKRQKAFGSDAYVSAPPKAYFMHKSAALNLLIQNLKHESTRTNVCIGQAMA